MTSRPRRDFLLDSGGVSALAADRDLLGAYLELLRLRFDGALLVPVRYSPRCDPAIDTLTCLSTV